MFFSYRVMQWGHCVKIGNYILPSNNSITFLKFLQAKCQKVRPEATILQISDAALHAMSLIQLPFARNITLSLSNLN